MAVMKRLLGFFLSLRTALWLLLALIFTLLYGSVIMPMKEEFQALQADPLLGWLLGAPVSLTWWLWAAVGILSLLTANTLVCSIDSVVRKRKARQWLLVVSPQVIHLGFLFILLAHLVSSYGSFKGMAFAYEGTVLRLPNGTDLVFEDIKTDSDASGYMKNWSAKIIYYSGDTHIKDDIIRPNSPSFHEGLGVYIKTIKVGPFPVALIEVSREPGAPWALAGSILFMTGMITLLILKIKREED